METILLQITSGRGPAECCWVVAQALKLMIEEAKKAGIQYQILHREKGIENGTLFSASIQLEGKGASTLSQQWTGTIQWIGQSQFRRHHKRKNWFIAINRTESMADNGVIKEKDISYQAIRSGGPGGQHVNKVSTAIRARHLPSGLSVLVSESRSQHQNKKLAKDRLNELIQEEQINQRKDQLKDEWRNHTDIQRGNPVKIFYGSDFKARHTETKYKKQRRSLKNDLRKALIE